MSKVARAQKAGSALKNRAVLIGPVAKVNSLLRAQIKSLQLNSRQSNRVRHDVIIGVDGGMGVCKKLGLKPSLALGDWDSLKSRSLLKNVNHVTLPKEKDQSDLAFAIEAALALVEVEELIAFGVTGGRPDHHQASLFELAEASVGCPLVRAWDSDADYYFISGPKRVTLPMLPMGRVLSVFSLDGEAKGVSLKGLKYSLSDVDLSPSSRGLSNEVLSSRTAPEVSLRKGKLLVVIPRVVR